MGEIQNKSKPFLVPLILGEWEDISPEGKEQIATWITMFTIIVEQADPRTASLRREDWEEFMHTKRPLNGWQIYVGQYGGNAQSANFHHWGAGLHVPPVTREASVTCNTQTTTATVGKFLFQSICSRDDTFRSFAATAYDHNAASLGLIRLWPTRGHGLTKPAFVIGDNDVLHVSTALSKALMDGSMGL
jgi:hypothetical protein